MPERKPPEAFVDELKSLVAANVAGNVELLGRLSELVREAVRETAERPQAPPDAAALLGRWLDFNLAAYSAVSTHGLALLNGLLAAAERTVLSRPRAAAPASAPAAPAAAATSTTSATTATTAEERRIDIRLEGRQGERVSAPFLVENHYDRGLEVTFEAGPLVPGSGQALPGSLVAFEPARLAVPPRSQAVVHAALELSGDFVPGQTYETTVRVLGFKAQQVRLAVTVLPEARKTPAPAEETPRPAQRARPERRRRAKAEVKP